MEDKYKRLLLFSIGGLVYCMIELCFRGHTHWTMYVAGGVCFLLCGGLNEYFAWDIPVTIQMLTCGFIITVVELICGLVLNIWLHLDIWDYSQLPGNLLGQICPQFTLAWIGVSAIAIILDDYIRYWFFGEEKPRYRIF